MKLRQRIQNPYRAFFTLGLLYALWGVGLWIPFTLGLGTFYPGLLHTHLMIGGFLSSFAFGFLMTAVPRFTKSEAPTFAEVGGVLTPLLLLPFAALFSGAATLDVLHLMSFIGFAIFGLRRFRDRQANLPAPFVFIAFGIGSGILGASLMLVFELFGASERLFVLGRLLYFQCYMLALVIGVGSRLVPALLGHAPMPDLPPVASTGNRPIANTFFLAGFLFVGTYVLEAFAASPIAAIVRTVITVFLLLKFWKLATLPRKRSGLTWGVWTSGWMTLAGIAGAAAIPSYSIHFMHLAFIGGLGVLTMMIATHVTLSHGGRGHLLTRQWTSSFWIFGLAVLAGLTRVSAGFLPRVYNSHLMYAAMSWLLAIAIWIFAVGKYLWRDSDEPSAAKSNC